MSAIEKQSRNIENDALAAIRELHEKDQKASLKGDVETLLSLFTDDGILIPASGDIVQGKEALRNMLLQDLELQRDYSVIEYKHDFREIKITGEYAYEWGFYCGISKSKKDGSEIKGSGKLMRILRQQKDRNWKVARSIWTADE